MQEKFQKQSDDTWIQTQILLPTSDDCAVANQHRCNFGSEYDIGIPALILHYYV